MAATSPKIQLLQASVDEGDDESHFRFLVDGKFVKYVTVDPKLYTVDDMCFAPILISLLPPFPAGDWNDGHVKRDSKTSQPHFARMTRTQFPGVKHTWHATSVDHLELHMGRKLRLNVYEAMGRRFNDTVVAKFAIFPWEIPYLEAETVAYEWIEGRKIGPKFLGHLTEEDRVIGFLIERIPDRQHASPEDLSLCQQTLSRLHKLGIRHGDVNRHNFLIHHGQAILIDFDSASKCNDSKALKEEFQSLQRELKDASGRGGSLVVTDGHGKLVRAGRSPSKYRTMLTSG